MKADADYWKGFWAGRAIAVRLAGLKAPESNWCVYGGVELPPLPKWDDKTYPYAIIARTRVLPYTFVVSGTPMWMYDSGNYEVIDWNPPAMRSYSSGSYWGEFLDDDGSNNIRLTDIPFVWANHDVKKDGSVRIAASNPVPALSGNWVYGGVKLPKLPEIDNKTYPYAVIYRYTSRKEYFAQFYGARPYRDKSDNSVHVPECNYGQANLSDGEWVPFFSDKQRPSILDISLYIPIWTNTNILNTDESVYLAASEPIPTT